MHTQALTAGASVLAAEPKSLAQLQHEARERIDLARLRWGVGPVDPALDPAEGLPVAPISVADWCAILSPEQLVKYSFTAYDCLLSLTALQTIQNHDFATEGTFGRERATYDNLRLAMSEMYEASSCEVLLGGGRLSVQLCVPGGSLSHWPVHLPKPCPGATVPA